MINLSHKVVSIHHIRIGSVIVEISVHKCTDKLLKIKKKLFRLGTVTFWLFFLPIFVTIVIIKVFELFYISRYYTQIQKL